MEHEIKDLSNAVTRYYRSSPLLQRVLVFGRPYICPFAPLLRWVEPNSEVLDIGCGVGLWLIYMAEAGLISSGTGCDVNLGALQQAREAAKHFQLEHGKPAFTFLQAQSVQNWPAKEFDTVSLIDVLHHIVPAEQESFLLEAFRRVRPGGRLIYKDMADSPFWLAAGNRLHDLILASQWINYFPLERVLKILENNGGRLLHKDHWRRYWYGHEMLIIERI